jgi:hypothetical protein
MVHLTQLYRADSTKKKHRKLYYSRSYMRGWGNLRVYMGSMSASRIMGIRYTFDNASIGW